MKIVIDIPEKVIKAIQNGKDYRYDIHTAIAQGTPLPKGHGRLIDADKLKLARHDIHVEEIDYYHRCVSIENIDEAPTIIEADKTESEE